MTFVVITNIDMNRATFVWSILNPRESDDEDRQIFSKTVATESEHAPTRVGFLRETKAERFVGREDHLRQPVEEKETNVYQHTDVLHSL